MNKCILNTYKIGINTYMNIVFLIFIIIGILAALKLCSVYACKHVSRNIPLVKHVFLKLLSVINQADRYRRRDRRRSLHSMAKTQ